LEEKAKRSVRETLLTIYGKAGILVILLIMAILLSAFTSTFLTYRNLINVLRQVTFYSIIGFGEMVIIITGGFDMSAGSIVGLTSILTAMLAQKAGMPVVMYFLLAACVGLAVGIFNGGLVAYVGVPPFIATMGSQIICRGLALLISNGKPVNGLNENFIKIGTGSFGPIPIPIVIMAIVCLITWYLMKYTKTGRHIFAVGGNATAALVSGIKTKNIKMFVFLYEGLLCGIAGMVLTARVSSGQPSLGEGYEMQAIAGAVIGGVSLSGGVGSVYGVICGALVIGVLNNGMDLLNINGYWQQIAQGSIIVIAVVLDILRQRTANRRG